MPKRRQRSRVVVVVVKGAHRSRRRSNLDDTILRQRSMLKWVDDERPHFV